MPPKQEFTVNSVLDQSKQLFAFCLSPERNTPQAANENLLCGIPFYFPSCHSSQLLTMCCLLPVAGFHWFSAPYQAHFSCCVAEQSCNDLFQNKSQVSHSLYIPMLSQTIHSHSTHSPKYWAAAGGTSRRDQVVLISSSAFCSHISASYRSKLGGTIPSPAGSCKPCHYGEHHVIPQLLKAAGVWSSTAALASDPG